MSLEVMKQALDVLDNYVDDPRCQKEIDNTIAVLRQAIAEAEKPVLTFDGLTATEFGLLELYKFQEATGCDTADEFKAEKQDTDCKYCTNGCVACDARLAEKQKPVAMQMDVIVVNLVREGINKHRARELAEHFIKHTSPPQRQWVGLTYEDMVSLQKDLHDKNGEFVLPTTLAMAVEAKLKEKNNG